MPYVNIQITREGATAFVIIDKVDTDNWGIAGQTVTEVAERACGPGSPASIERQPSAA